MRTGIEQIVQHPAVSRCMAPLPTGDPRIAEWRTPGLCKLVKLRKARRDVKRAAANMREELEAGHRGYEGGGIMEVPPMPGSRLLREALAAGELPEDLRKMIEAYLGL